MHKEIKKPKYQASIKIVLTLYSVFLIAATGLLSAVMTITSGNSALDKSQDACDAGLKTCFSAGQNQTIDMGRDLMDQVIHSFETAIKQKLSLPLSILTAEKHMCKTRGLGKGNFTNDMATHDTLLKQLTLGMIEAVSTTASIEITIRSVDANTNQTVYYLMNQGYEPKSGTIDLNRWLGVEVKNGSWDDLSQGTLYFSIVDHATGLIIPENLSKVQECVENFTDILYWQKSRGSAQFTPCHTAMSNLSKADTGRGTGSFIQHIQYGVEGWAPLEAKGELVSLSAYYAELDTTSPDAKYGENSGYWITVGVQVEDLSQTAKESTSNLPFGSRIYLIERDPWTGSMGSMVAATHGGVTNVVNNSNTVITPSQSTDPLIAAHGRYEMSLSSDPYINVKNEQYDWTYAEEEEQYWVKHSAIELSKDSPHSLLLIAVVLIPVDASFAQISNSFSNLSNKIEQDRSSVRDDTDANIRYLWLSLTGMLCILALVAYCCSYRIAAGITRLADEMKLVETFDLETVDLSSTSYLTEVNRMQQSFEKMLKSLKDYRAFLPKVTVAEGLCATNTEDEPDDTDRDSKETASSFHSLARPTPAPTPGQPVTTPGLFNPVRFDTISYSQPPTPGDRDGSGGSSHTATPTKKNPTMVRRRSIGNVLHAREERIVQTLMERKAIVVLTVKLYQMYEWVARVREGTQHIDSLVSFIAEWVERVEQCVTKHKGLLLSTSLGEGEITAVWGYSKRDFTGLTTAADAALAITAGNTLIEKTSTTEASVISGPNLQTYAAITEGPGWTGNLGSGRTRSPAVIGHQISDNLGMLKVGFQHQCPVVTNRHGGLEAYEVTPVDCCHLHSIVSVGGNSYGKGSTMVYSIVKKSKQGEEWMYALNAMQQKMKPIFDAYALYQNGNIEEAKVLAATLASSKANPLYTEANRLLSLLNGVAADSPPPTPPSDPAPDPPLVHPFRNPLTTPRRVGSDS